LQPFCLFLAFVEELEGRSESCGENFHQKSAFLLEISCLLLVTCDTEFSQSIGLLFVFFCLLFYHWISFAEKRETEEKYLPSTTLLRSSEAKQRWLTSESLDA
jgi:hypothetical protein